MKKIGFFLFCLCFSVLSAWAQDDEADEKGFKKENLFTGGSVSLAFYNNTFLVGGSPVFGYSLTNWVDLGLVVNYNYTSYRDVSYYGSDDKLRQSVYGGGSFIRLYPVRFLFAQAQVEHNFLRQKYIPSNGTGSTVEKHEANSFLVGAGYTTNRYADNGQPFFYVAVLFDIAKAAYSPYTDAFGRTIPIVRAGVQVPLFQGRNREDYK
ncbi:hypothetical protein [Terrimonas alba]|uniref:hypothetical protein n=1 Tax=Terrimonas alba TaxID=3349636 RepID=UPI0035F3DAF6